jgi:hypothetical protein
MTVARCLCAFIALLLMCAPSSAKGGSLRSEDRYNPQHIESLPSEIRSAIMRKCSTPRALHDFAKYSENLQRVVLHFENFYCDNQHTFCAASGCLHEVYVSAGGHYRLRQSYYSPN